MLGTRNYLAVEVWDGMFHQDGSHRIAVANADMGTYGCIYKDGATSTCNFLFDESGDEDKPNSHIVIGDIGGVPGRFYEIRKFHDGRYVLEEEQNKALRIYSALSF